MNDELITDMSQIALHWLNSLLIDSKALVEGSKILRSQFRVVQMLIVPKFRFSITYKQ
ncbi:MULTISPECIES: hypothetical protein [Nostoc]|uniref:Uncharacterized protein n=2 Tax=Nostoc TaxID=1177 RepID=A0ABR8I294_9NOSO|nr:MULTISPECIES: hypothetical protein [Nostoc]MBD2559813.1 hypothetical protein [Nostoc linckia FACHB-391]MBD2645223.1 hypothetical protein [Nostoc foliaceum FACHB-393]